MCGTVQPTPANRATALIRPLEPWDRLKIVQSPRQPAILSRSRKSDSGAVADRSSGRWMAAWEGAVRFQTPVAIGIGAAILFVVFLAGLILLGGRHTGGGSAPGTRSSLGLAGMVHYTVRDAGGAVRSSDTVHNTVNDAAKNEVFKRIALASAGDPYDAIVAISSDSDSPSNGILANNVTTNLDGDLDTAGNQNPAKGTVNTLFDSQVGAGTVQVTFTAESDDVTIKQIALTRNAAADTTGGTTAISSDDIFSYVDVPNVTLNTGDTVQYTWTVTVQ